MPSLPTSGVLRPDAWHNPQSWAEITRPAWPGRTAVIVRLYGSRSLMDLQIALSHAARLEDAGPTNSSMEDPSTYGDNLTIRARQLPALAPRVPLQHNG